MEITPKPPTAKGPAEWFTGDVFIDGIVRGEEPSHVRVSAVRFTPSARTAWHSHAVGQTLYVTDGRGLVQSRGGEVAEIRAGGRGRAGREGGDASGGHRGAQRGHDDSDPGHRRPIM